MARKPGAPRTFYEVISAAMEDLAVHGFDSVERVAHWDRLIREAAERTLTPQATLERALREAYHRVYRQLIEQGRIVKYNPGVERFVLNRLRPELRAELDRRILASANLIRLNRQAEIQKTLQRFAGWATSIPKGGSDAIKTRVERENIRKPLTSLPFRERRVLIDQGHKLTSALSEIVAQGSGAIGGIWRSHWREANYDYREDHKERDGTVYLVRDSWAMGKGFVKLAGHEYIDDVTKPGEEVFCRCTYQWIYNLQDLPKEMLTVKGRAALAVTA